MAGPDGRRGAGCGAQRAVPRLPLSGYGAQCPGPGTGRAVRCAGHRRCEPLLSAQRPAAALPGEPKISQSVVSAHGIPLRIPPSLAQGQAGCPAVESGLRYCRRECAGQPESFQCQAPADLGAPERLRRHCRGGQGGGRCPDLPMAGGPDPRHSAPAGAGILHR